jgi:nicotinate-nucleotide adenylyltransferase
MPDLIGLFGGTFDPPHNGHLALARLAYRQLGLNRLLWIVTPDPPHKPGRPAAPAEDRLAMVRLCLQGTPFEPSTIEFDRPGPHYALDTLRQLAERLPQVQFVYLMGGDSLRDLPTWHRPADLLAALSFLGVMRRPGDRLDLPALETVLPGLTAKVRFVKSPPLRAASHEIRRRVAEGRSFRHLLPAGVADYILQHRLYQA